MSSTDIKSSDMLSKASELILKNTITEYEILLENIYNLNKTGFTMELCTTTKIITNIKQSSYSLIIINSLKIFQKTED
uniref:Uncharacterized protein n=1 Tax=Coccidioides posadasii RMSCC 3488 TaxID=454284 RepID=A0A0J6F7G1_COCPO|nr:hypothetical protein CPAG_05244 [Coccidioides posadasii RMSCC 3488]